MTASGTDRNGLIVTLGFETDTRGLKSLTLKVWDPETLLIKNPAEYKPRKTIPIGKPGQAYQPTSFAVNLHANAAAIGMNDGTLYTIRSRGNGFEGEVKDSQVIMDAKAPINSCFFSTLDNQLHVFLTTRNGTYCYQNMQAKKPLVQVAAVHIDVNSAGSLFLATDPTTIVQCNQVGKVNSWTIEGEKLLMRCFKKDYIIVTYIQKTESGVQTAFSVFDLVNTYLAISGGFTSILNVVPAGDSFFLISMNQRGEKQLLKFDERDNNYKLETFFKKTSYDVALRFAKNQGYEPALLAEISRMHGDHLYSKGDFAGAIKNYKLTVPHIEPSYVIRKFLDVSQMEFLIEYLEHIHDSKIAEKPHTALLLNCYVKQKAITKLEKFLDKSSVDSELFDTETAITVCRELTYKDLALKLAKTCKNNDQVLKIYIEDKKEFRPAIDFIKNDVELSAKSEYVKQFGQTLIKYEPERTLELIQKLVSISIMKKPTQRSYAPDQPRVLSAEDRDLLGYLNVKDVELDQLADIIFPKPDEFLPIFMNSNDYLERFLTFLKNLKNLPNDKVIFHRMFEFYLQQYHKAFVAKQATLMYQKTADPEMAKYEKLIIDVLREPMYDERYDKNHCLILFKMYNFQPGITFLCEKMQMREELLSYYIEINDHVKVLDLCRRYGETENNLWIQALKYFCKPENKDKNKIPDVLEYISKIEALSPLVILNILSRNQNIPYGLIKTYFLKKLQEERTFIEKDGEKAKENMEKAKASRAEYKKLKTQAKVFQTNRCAECDFQLTLPSIHFMCGHSFHENCLISEGREKECSKCKFDNNEILDRKKQFEAEADNSRMFFEKLSTAKNKFDLVAEYLGRGLFNHRKEENP
eukprot:TRINITY_DN6172_c0_g1_i1.p1 TRINITY_DN6172_c0_g1~~TRINITY_DN6172_c0_g1_i1.p1  ORF type:complete len:866 (-),score=298.83 TRINITY_DN6172_c0_g1_i1:134-2731(-)